MTLDWQETEDGWRAGPFIIFENGAMFNAAVEDFELQCLVFTVKEAKAACQRLVDTVREME